MRVLRHQLPLLKKSSHLITNKFTGKQEDFIMEYSWYLKSPSSNLDPSNINSFSQCASLVTIAINYFSVAIYFSFLHQS
jgi:hypothetical protein